MSEVSELSMREMRAMVDENTGPPERRMAYIRGLAIVAEIMAVMPQGKASPRKAG